MKQINSNESVEESFIDDMKELNDIILNLFTKCVELLPNRKEKDFVIIKIEETLMWINNCFSKESFDIKLKKKH